MLEVNVSLWLTLGVIPPHFTLRSARVRADTLTHSSERSNGRFQNHGVPSRTLL